jgi:hypothetical protein
MVGAAEFVEGSEFDHDLSFSRFLPSDGRFAPAGAFSSSWATGYAFPDEV